MLMKIIFIQSFIFLANAANAGVLVDPKTMVGKEYKLPMTGAVVVLDPFVLTSGLDPIKHPSCRVDQDVLLKVYDKAVILAQINRKSTNPGDTLTTEGVFRANGGGKFTGATVEPSSKSAVVVCEGECKPGAACCYLEPGQGSAISGRTAGIVTFKIVSKPTSNFMYVKENLGAKFKTPKGNSYVIDSQERLDDQGKVIAQNDCAIDFAAYGKKIDAELAINPTYLKTKKTKPTLKWEQIGWTSEGYPVVACPEGGRTCRIGSSNP